MIFDRKFSPAWLILALSLVVTALAGINTERNIDERLADQDAYEADHITQQIQDRLNSYALALRGTSALFGATLNVVPQTWQIFMRDLIADNRLHGIVAVGFAQLTPSTAIENLESAQRNSGATAFTVWPKGDRTFSAPTVFIEPTTAANQEALGFDSYSDPTRREAMERAAEAGTSVLSRRTTLVQTHSGGSEADIVVYRPIYTPGASLETPEQRRMAVAGWAFIEIDLGGFMNAILEGWEHGHDPLPHIHVYDGDQAVQEKLLYDGGTVGHVHPNLPPVIRIIDFRGHRWLLEFLPERPDPMGYMAVWTTYGAGTAISGLLFFLLISLIGRRQEARAMAAELTVDLQRAQAALTTAEERWRAALEASELGVWDWDIASGTVYYSPLARTMLRFDSAEASRALDDWKNRLHPDDRADALERLDAYLTGTTQRYTGEYRLRGDDGVYRWMADRGMVFERAAGGKPSRIVGTYADITKLKTIQIDLERSHTELLEAQRIAHVGSWSVDFATGQAQWSDETYRMFGRTRSDGALTLTEFPRHVAPESWTSLDAAMKRTTETGAGFEQEFQIIKKDGSQAWVLGRGEAVRNAAGAIIGLRGTSADITARRTAEIKSQRARMLYDALNACNAAILRCESDMQLFHQVAEIVVRHGGMRLAWVGVIDPSSGDIKPVTAYGEGTKYLDGLEVSARAGVPQEQGPTGIAARENRPIWLDDFQSNPRTAPWHERGARFGWRASAALPLRRNGVPAAVLTFYATETAAFDEEIRTLLNEMSAQISFALDKLDADARVTAHFAELKRWYSAMLGREGRILELKQEVNDALAKAGDKPRYAQAEDVSAAARPE